MVDDTQTTWKPQANLADVNRILGNRARGSAGPVGGSRTEVVGVNPQKITCSDIIVYNTMSFAPNASMITPFTAMNGSAGDVGIRFAYGSIGTGIYSPMTDRISISVVGSDVCTFTSAGVGLTNIFSPTGTIDFGGATLTGISGITINPRSYDIAGTPVTTIGATTANALNIPLTPPAGTSATWDLDTKIIYVLAGSGGAVNGTYTMRTRAFVPVGGTTATISAQYQTTTVQDPLFVGISIAVITQIGANAAHVNVTGRAGQTIIWQAKSSIVRVES